MARKKSSGIRKKTLGILIFIALIIQHIFPQIMLGNISWIATAIYLFVGIYLLIS